MLKASSSAIALFVLVGCSSSPPPGAHSAELRLTPTELEAQGASRAVAAGTSAVDGIQTSFVTGNPQAAGIYTIMLRIPPHTTIAAHSHPDDRVATVVSGTWQFGYGSRFDAEKLRSLPPQSYYTEPPAVAHFARTGAEPVVLLITGYGPTGTSYVDAQNDPRH
jgi:quercetin dioxygenase-like cupin family protein